MPRRFDATRFDAPERTPQGGLKIPARPTSAGVFPYQNGDGTIRRELRHPDDVFDAKSLKSLAAAPVTDLHPDQPVTPDNWRSLTVGHVSESLARDGIYVAAPLLIQDANEIRMIDAREREELSCGYSCDIVPEAGVYEGQPYDVRQKNIVYNHVAIGPRGWGRQGAEVAIRLDAADAMRLDGKQFDTPAKPGVPEKRMKTIRIDGIDYPADSDAAQQALDKLNASRTAHITELEAKNVSLASGAAKEKERADKAEKDLKDTSEKLKIATDPKTIHAAAAVRADMLDKVRRIHTARQIKLDKKDEEAMAGSSDTEILTNAIKKMDPKVNLEGKTPETVAAIFEVLFNAMMERAGEGGGAEDIETDEPIDEPLDGGAPAPPLGGRTDGGEGGRQSVHDARRGTGRRQDANEREEGGLAAQERHRKDSAQAWTQPLAVSKDRRDDRDRDRRR